MNLDHQDAHHALGAYLLGALDAEEARSVEAHVATCAECRAEIEELETLPALLDAVPRGRAEALLHAPTAPDGPLAPPALLEKVRARRRTLRLRWAGGLAAAAAASLATGMALGPVFAPAEAGHAPTPTATPSSSPSATYSLTSSDGAHVDLALVRKGWGTELDVVCLGMPSAGVFSVWVVTDDGAQERAASWSSTGYAGRAVLTGATSYQLAAIRSIQIRDGSQHTLASVTLPATP